MVVPFVKVASTGFPPNIVRTERYPFGLCKTSWIRLGLGDYPEGIEANFTAVEKGSFKKSNYNAKISLFV